jgi:arylsulfatase A-like enzyme
MLAMGLIVACGLAHADAAQDGGDEPKRAQPNLVLIVADDLGYADVGFNGCTDIPTPSIDRIAAEGVRFTEAYVTGAVCGPSRAGMITGRYQDRFGCGNNPTVNPAVPNGVPRTERMISELLRPAGYESKAVGKWHLGTFPGLHPQDRGFDEFYGFLTGGHNYFPENLTLEDLSEVTQKWAWYRTKLLDNGVRVGTTKYLTDELSDKAVEFIDRDRPLDAETGQSAPFFLYLCYNAPHTPMQATDEYLARFEGIKNERRRTYAAMVSAMDDGIGRVLDALDRRGLADETIVVFLSDNGGATNNASRNTPLRGFKSSEFEGGIRVPFAMRWPGVVESGRVYEHPISSLDIAATIVEAAGPDAKAQVRETHPLDGVDLRPYLTGDNDGTPHDVLFWRWHHRDHGVVRMGDLKLIERGEEGGGDLLFDVEHDISERRNLMRLEVNDAGEMVRVGEGWEKAGILHETLGAWTAGLMPPAHPSLGSWTFDQQRLMCD